MVHVTINFVAILSVKAAFDFRAILLLMKTVLAQSSWKKMSSLSIEVWFFISKYLRFTDLIEALRMEFDYFKLWRIYFEIKRDK